MSDSTRVISAFISNNTRRITCCDLLLWLDFALFDKLPFKIVFRETFEIIRLVTPDNVSKHLYFFFGRANSNLDSLTRSLDSETSEIKLGPSGLCFLLS